MMFIFLLCLILPATTGDSYEPQNLDWNSVTVARAGVLTVLDCRGAKGTGGYSVNWTYRGLNDKESNSILSVDEMRGYVGVAWKHTMAMDDPNYQNSKDFSMSFIPMEGDEGLYTCIVARNRRIIKDRVILLELLTVIVNPSFPIPKHSNLRLITHIVPNIANSQVTWTSPSGLALRSETDSGRTVAKLPLVEMSDKGVYVCKVFCTSNTTPFLFNVSVDIGEDNVNFIQNVRNEMQFSQAAVYQTPFILHCPPIKGDYVYLYWQPPNTVGKTLMKKVYTYDRWRKLTFRTEERHQLAGLPYNADAGNFSFLLDPDRDIGGLYICEVFLDDQVDRWTTRVSVLKVVVKPTSSKLNLHCLYSERSQVQVVHWEHQNTSNKLEMFSMPGKVQICVPLPITPQTAGIYTCTLMLKNRQTVSMTHTVTLPPKEGASIATPSLPPFLYALLLLPLVAVAVGVLLWRQKHISNRGIEQPLSVHLGETENVYENPEDIRQAAPPGSEYMDLKPRADDDVYKELEW